MATQTSLLPRRFHLDQSSREAGRRGLVKARAALDEARRRSATPDPDGPDHARAA